jgi:hypothetical protein
VVDWNDNKSAPDGRGPPAVFLCAGYVADEGPGLFTMNVRIGSAYLYIKDNGAVHADLLSEALPRQLAITLLLKSLVRSLHGRGACSQSH